MKYALVNGDKTEAQPGQHGICAYCQSDAIAKCGEINIWHWAHKCKVSCDPWWENETEWHRTWKNHYPPKWQEITHQDSATGERHVADIKTDKEFVIEFQHSAIKSTEIKSREDFYKNMVWVVDGTRLKSDYLRFNKGLRCLRNLNAGFFLSASPESCFPASWLTSSVPVYFDFQGIAPNNEPDFTRATLWCLFPGRVEGTAIIACVAQKQFVELSSTTPHLLRAQELILHIAQFIRQERACASPRVDPLAVLRRNSAIRRRL